MSVPITITNAGLAALINASGTGTAAIVIAAIGLSPTAITPAATMTALPGETARVTTISGSVVSPNTIHVVMQDTSANAYSANAFGLYLNDGTLFAVYGQPTPIYVKTAASAGLLAIDVTFAAALAGSITFGNANFINPPASNTVMGVVQLATLAQAQAGSDATDVITPATAKGSILNWLGFTPLNAALYTAASVLAKLITVDGAGSGVDADLFHGQTPDQLIAAYFSSGNNANGTWEKRPNHIMEQWGSIDYTTQYENPAYGRGPYTITFAQPFANTNYSINLTNHNPQQHYDDGTWLQIVSKSVGSCTIYNMWTGGGDGTIYGLDWRAIGTSA